MSRRQNPPIFFFPVGRPFDPLLFFFPLGTQLFARRQPHHVNQTVPVLPQTTRVFVFLQSALDKCVCFMTRHTSRSRFTFYTHILSAGTRALCEAVSCAASVHAGEYCARNCQFYHVYYPSRAPILPLLCFLWFAVMLFVHRVLSTGIVKLLFYDRKYLQISKTHSPCVLTPFRSLWILFYQK